MSVATTAYPAGITAFPAAKVESCLRNELLQAVEAAATLKGIRMLPGSAGRSAMSIQIDSLVVVELLCAVEPILNLELPDSVVRAGGYRSINEAVGHLMPRIEKEWQKHKGKGCRK